jgi:hypothetical protein
MAIRSCRVAICDRDGVDHTVQVTASTLYEAVALGLASIRGEEWVGAIPEGLNTVRVSVTSVPVEHSVKIQDFKTWLERGGRHVAGPVHARRLHYVARNFRRLDPALF